ncbi:hypothetical protein MC885_014190 [Smutsia gigantea]|nr:hypothetical protein MC885_014190 [Smutsia gigantea]
MAALQEKKSCSQRMEEFQRYCWNPDTGQMLGRTLSRWVWISLYYVGFYVVMTGLFALCIYVLMCTLDPYTPDYQDQLKSPGYSPASQEGNVNCTSERYFFQEGFWAPNHTKFSCKFTEDMLQNCSGLADPSFGFAEGKPCFIIKMNRIVNFLPSNSTAPRVDCAFRVSAGGTSSSVLTGLPCAQLSVSPDRLSDTRPLQVDYYPPTGTFSLHYFPYYGRKAQPHYSNPLVAAKLLNVPRDTEVVIVCKILADHVAFDNPHDPYEGRVEFKLRIQE